MALTVNHPLLKETRVYANSASIGGTPIAACAAVMFRGVLGKIGAVVNGSITTADCAVAVAVNGVTVAAAAFTIPVAGAALGQLATATPTSPVYVNEDDVITFTPSGASGSSIPATFFANIKMA